MALHITKRFSPLMDMQESSFWSSLRLNSHWGRDPNFVLNSILLKIENNIDFSTLGF